MLRLLIALSSINHLHAVIASIAAAEVIGFTILYLKVRSDVVAMRTARKGL